MNRSIIIILALASFASAQRGDRGQQQQPEVWREMDVPAAPALSPEEALKTFHLAPGFRIELVAAEPLLENPVEIRWDGNGRIWAVEMRAYMPKVDGTGEDARIGRISVLEDTDDDGQMDKQTIFLDALQMPRALALVEGGVLVAEPPSLWYCQDTDGDLVCDEKNQVTKYGSQGPVEHTENGILPAMDNWMYNAKSSRRFRFSAGEIMDEKVNGKGQWGIVQDNYGRLYYNSNSSYLHVDQVPGHYFFRNGRSSKGFGLGAAVHRTSEIFSSRVNPGINRGYQGGMLLTDGRLGRVTAVCGPTIYRGDQFPKTFVGDAFVPEPSANAIAHFKLEEHGIEVKGEHQTYPHPRYEKVEFLTSTDERFRPVNTYTGPDGCLYVLDMYHGILQHKVYVTTYLRTQIEERGLDQDNMRGRLYRIVHEDGPKPPPPLALEQASTRELIRQLAHENGVLRDTAQRLLVQRKAPATQGLLEGLPDDAYDDHLFFIHALWTLDGLGQPSGKLFERACRHPHPKVRLAALQTGEGHVSAETCFTLIDDPDPAVRIQLAFSLGALESVSVRITTLLRLLKVHGDDRLLQEAAMSSLAGDELLTLQMMQTSDPWQDPTQAGPLMKRLAVSLFSIRRPEPLEHLLAFAATETRDWVKQALLEGISSSGGKSKPVVLAQKPAAVDLLDGHPALGPALRYVTWKGDDRQQAVPAQLSAPDQALFNVGKMYYTVSCMTCHQVNGAGLPALAPTLIDTPWVMGPDERLVAIVLDGLMGVIEVDEEEWNLVMPPHRDHPTLDDKKIAGILTYIRNSFGNEGKPVQPATVKRIRESTLNRQMPWTVKELKNLKQASGN
jgi:mono/diheme cytochrome c family protein/glucose/arabinose dehydrogenase